MKFNLTGIEVVGLLLVLAYYVFLRSRGNHLNWGHYFGLTLICAGLTTILTEATILGMNLSKESRDSIGFIFMMFGAVRFASQQDTCVLLDVVQVTSKPKSNADLEVVIAPTKGD